MEEMIALRVASVVLRLAAPLQVLGKYRRRRADLVGEIQAGERSMRKIFPLTRRHAALTENITSNHMNAFDGMVFAKAWFEGYMEFALEQIRLSKGWLAKSEVLCLFDANCLIP